MSADVLAGLFRTFAAAGAGYLVAKGVDADTANAVIGAVGTLAVAGWSVYSKKGSK